MFVIGIEKPIDACKKDMSLAMLLCYNILQQAGNNGVECCQKEARVKRGSPSHDE
jgi:hypothetical protein